MKTIIATVAVAAVLALTGSYLLAQEVIKTPAPAGKAAATVESQLPPAPPVSATAAVEHWRYRWFDGHWWYWTPQNRWMWYRDDGQWVEFDPDRLSAADPNPASPTGYYNYPGPGYYAYPGPRNWTGYYPGVAVGVGPYGYVDVGVGQRISVNVWGPRGGVRVGRIYVGW